MKEEERLERLGELLVGQLPQLLPAATEHCMRHMTVVGSVQAARIRGDPSW